MIRSRWRVPALAVLSAVAVAGLSGCGGSGHASGTATAGTVAQAGSITAARLRAALLTRINGEPASTPAAAGRYSSLPEVQAAQKSADMGTVLPKSCARDAVAGFQSADLAGAPAAAVTFRVGRNAISETLVAPASTTAAEVVSKALPAGCGQYRVVSGGKTYRYTAKDHVVTGIGQQARVVNVEAAGQAGGNVWSVLYRGAGFIGAITVVGPNASELAVRELGLQAYGYAAKSLS